MGAMVVRSWFEPIRCYTFSPFYWSFIAVLLPLFTAFPPLSHSYVHFLCRIDNTRWKRHSLNGRVMKPAECRHTT